MINLKMRNWLAFTKMKINHKVIPHFGAKRKSCTIDFLMVRGHLDLETFNSEESSVWSILRMAQVTCTGRRVHLRALGIIVSKTSCLENKTSC
jgi:hypothetical protein